MDIMDKISVVIPTYNRFKYLQNAINSVKMQTYKNIEIIVVNDGSTQKEYYEHKYDDDIIVINLEINSKNKFGYACVGHVINCGIAKSTGKYIAFLDDDDVWINPNKLDLQISAMQKTGCKMSCTEGLTGKGVYNKNKKYQIYNAEANYKEILNIYRMNGSNLLENGYPDIFDLNFIKIHNCIIACSVIIHKDVIDIIGKQREIKMGGDMINGNIVYIDYDYWLRALHHTNCAYVKYICIYYDDGHGDGNDY
jgi:glycosyltransferase involved in cell wall biosynthesis